MNENHASTIPGWYDWHQWAGEIIQSLPDPAVYVEVGCFLGRSTCAIAGLIRESKKAITLHAIDLFRVLANGDPDLLTFMDPRSLTEGGDYDFKARFEENLATHGVLDLVRIHQMPSLQAAALFPSESSDVVFIDAHHGYESVRADMAAWWPKVKSGGVMAGHDIHTYDTVWRAVNDECSRIGLKPRIIDQQNIWELCK